MNDRPAGTLATLQPLIEEHSLLSDQRSLALVDATGCIDWFCAPRVDSAALFARLLGDGDAGYFSIQAADGAAPLEQHYRGDTLTVRTRWPRFHVDDWLDCFGGKPTQRAGRSELVRVLAGHGRVRITFAPRLDFGRVNTRLEVSEHGVIILDNPEPIVLRSPGVRWTLRKDGAHDTAIAEVDLAADPVVLELRYGSGHLRPSAADIAHRQAFTEAYWANGIQQLVFPQAAHDLVRRSTLLLRGLVFGPTGAIAAAGTTSLPEALGGVRNWDYRYCWLRDAALTAACLLRLGSAHEAMRYLDWLLDVVNECESPDRLRPLYTVGGRTLGPEGEISELAGYRNSRPVRIGNAASRQVQLDVFGPIVDLVALLLDYDAPISSDHWRLVQAMVQAVEARWREPDHGIWEIRAEARHHVHSKVMCWQTIDRAVRVADRFLGRDRADWRGLRDEIARDVLDSGYKADLGHFTAAYDGGDTDAAALAVGLSGLLPPDDERFIRTVEAVERELLRGPIVYRYRSPDGLPGSEGGFYLCNAWLVEAYLLCGRRDDAQELFAATVATAGPTGMLPEEYDPELCVGLGNIPQAYSHLGIIENAISLSGR